MPNIKDLVENPHPVYSKYINFWSFTLNAYEGGIDYTQAEVFQNQNSSIIDTIKVNGKRLESTVTSNLFRHKKERSEDYIDRIRMSYYYNFCAPVIDIYTNHLFSAPIITDFANIEVGVEARMDDVDRCGSNLHEFRKSVAEYAQIYGHCFVVCDKPQAEQAPVSLAQQINDGMFPYFTIFAPYDVINWSLDEFGRAHWVLLREWRSGSVDFANYKKDNINLVQYRLWTRNEWYLFDADYELIEEGVHGLGVVPIECVYNKQSKKQRAFLGISEIADSAFIARDIYNRCSELNEIIRNQTFAFLAIQGKASDYDEVAVGTSKALLYPEGMATPSYVSPPGENARILMEQIDRQIHKIFQLAKLTGGSAAKGEEVNTQSGISKAFDFHETNAALSKKAGNMEDFEQRLWRVFAKWEGQESFDGVVSYPRDYNVKDLNEDLDEAERLLKFELGKTFNMTMKREMIKKKFPRITDDELMKMESEVETNESQSGAGATLRSRLPGLFNPNGNQPGKMGV
ncbi:MAG: hypothetical protein EOL91_09380 [Actinobacteria bacterium]|nr:hypothetical protein [Actinomycetota bacterium]